jgi:hypothetical protein
MHPFEMPADNRGLGCGKQNTPLAHKETVRASPRN